MHAKSLNRIAKTLSAFLLLPAALHAQKPQQLPIPAGLDSYRQWDQWPAQRVGMRAYMRSTYDRRGGNEGADASHFLYQLSDTFNVTLDLEGPGILMFSRFNHWHGSPWQFVIDGKSNTVSETASADPATPVKNSVYIPAAPFPPILNPTWTTTRGGDLMASPIGFEHSFTLAYGHTKYGTGYYIYDTFVPGTPLSQPITAWTENTIPSQDVVDFLTKAGTDIAPKAGQQGTVEKSGTLALPAAGPITVVDLKGKSSLRRLAFSIPEEKAQAFENVHLRITWDHRAQPSIDTPIALFYGAGTLFNRENREYLVKALPVSIRFHDHRIELACYFPMPFFKSAHVELVSNGTSVDDIHWSVRSQPLSVSPAQTSYFHATYKDIPTPTPGEDLVLLDTRNTEGSPVWTGSFVGTSFIFSHNQNLVTLEGDPRFFFDDSLTPQAQGTGTEEWGGGGDYWESGHQTTLPFMGHPTGAPYNSKHATEPFYTAKNDEDKIESTYRYLLGDLFPFGKNAVIHVEHGGSDESTEHYEAIAYWYGLPAASLIQTDQLQIGDATDEKAHNYVSPQASQPYALTSRYEVGVDHLDGKKATKEIFPETTDQGRTTTGASEFTLKLRPDNLGVLLRRKLDYQYPNQRAEAFIQSSPGGEWKAAGIWYLAGSNTVLYSNPQQQLGPPERKIETSNRRFRDDEFLIPTALTAGQSSIRVRVKFTPLNRPLFPGNPQDEQAWSEIKYTVYTFILPDFKP